MVRSVVKDTVQDFSESCTTHGISYIFQREQVCSHRLLWTCIVVGMISFALYLSWGAYTQWDESPIITTVSTTAWPIDMLEYPAITICGQGMDTETLSTVIESQFKKYLQKRSINIDELSEKEREDWRAKFQEDSYPGATVPLSQIAGMMSSPNPDNAAKAEGVKESIKAKVNPPPPALPPRSIQRGGCPGAWVSTTTSASFLSTFCYLSLTTKQTIDLARRNCQARKSILLEFESKKEVEDLGRLVKDGYLQISPDTEVWLGVKYDEQKKKFRYKYNRDLNVENHMEIAYERRSNQHCALIRPAEGKLRPIECNAKVLREVLCTRATDTNNTKKKRSSEPPGTDSERTKRSSELPETDSERTKRMVQEKPEKPEPPPYEMFLSDNETVRAEAEELKRASIKKYQDIFRSMNLTAAYDNLFGLLWHGINPCFDHKVTSKYKDEKSTIKRCYWKGVQVDCSSIFKTNPTDRGMCCTFNALEAEKLYQKSRFAEMVAKLQEENRKDAYEPGPPPRGFLSGEEPLPEIGKTRGLTLIIDAHTNILSPSTVQDDYEGFLAVVNERSKFPSIQEKGFVIRPGHENLVAISAIETIADSAIRVIPPTPNRKCYFWDEYKLDLHKFYSQSGCVFECLLRTGKAKITNENGCTPWFYPSKNTIMCDPWQTNDFVKSIFEGGASTKCDHCLPDCNGTTYTTSVSATPFRRCDAKNLGLSKLCTFDEKMYPSIWSEQVISDYKAKYKDDDIPQHVKDTIERGNAIRSFIPQGKMDQAVFKGLYDEKHDDGNYNAFEKDIALVHFFFHEPTVFQFKRSLRMTWVDFISQIGGVLGLCVGFSLISGLEILYWFTLRLGHRIFSRSKDNKQTVWIQPASYWIQPSSDTKEAHI